MMNQRKLQCVNRICYPLRLEFGRAASGFVRKGKNQKP